MKTFSRAEVATHNKTSDVWIVLHGKVYDVTPFIFSHPGGDEVIMQYAGQDATDAFEDVGHSEAARAMLLKFYIGDIAA